MAVRGGLKVAGKEFDVSTELLMRELLKLDGIEAEGDSKMQRKAEVCISWNLSWSFWNYYSSFMVGTQLTKCYFFQISQFFEACMQIKELHSVQMLSTCI